MTKKIRVHLSRHALERYLERVKGIDVGGISKHIEYAAQLAFDMEATSITIDGVRLAITDTGVITSALPTGNIHRKQRSAFNGPEPRAPRPRRDLREDSRRHRDRRDTGDTGEES